MTLKEFVEKYKGRELDYDGYYGAQCMDLMHYYIDEVLIGSPSPQVLAAPSAKLAYQNFNRPDLFTKLDNTPQGVPQEGDIVFWGGGEYGHVAVFLRGTVNDFTSFDQNYPTGSACHEQYHNYYNVLGWLRYKGTTMELKDTEIDWADFEGNFHTVGWYVHEWEVEKKGKERLADEIKEKNKDYERLQKTLSEQNLAITNLRNEVESMKRDKLALEGKIEALEVKLVAANEEVTDLENHLDEQMEKVTKYYDLSQELKSKLNKNLYGYTRWERFISLFRRR